LFNRVHLPDDTQSSQERDTFLEVESFLHCTMALELEKEHVAHSMLSVQAISEHLAERVLGHFAVDYPHSHVPKLVLLKRHY
jgi:hypothetical protein